MESKYCNQCGAEQLLKGNYCSSCGGSLFAEDDLFVLDNTSKVPVRRGEAAFLVTLCVLTIVGSVIGVFRGMLYQAIASIPNQGNIEYVRGLLFVIANIGTLIGAILMLNRKLTGLYVYTVSQVSYLLVIVWATSVYLGDAHTDIFALTIAAIFFLPSLAFLIMFWSDPVRKSLD